jgi:biotin transport system substrate-specific component
VISISRPYRFLWAIVGLLLTIAANFIDAYITSPPWEWLQRGVSAYPLGITCQVGVVLLISCVGGKNAGLVAQLAYLILGLLGLQIFRSGGGLGYWQQPTFGYLLGFVPGAWLCGSLAFKKSPNLERIAWSGLWGLLTIHCVGIVYLVFLQLISWQSWSELKFLNWLFNYSVYPFLSQLIMVCAISLMANIVRRIMFY